MARKPKQFMPNPHDKCLCGSDLKFKKCCGLRLPGSKSMGENFPRHCSEGNFELALLAARADVTQYTIWHKSHTASGLFVKTPIPTDHMWHVDVEALFHYVDRLRRSYEYLGNSKKFPAVLERLRSNIQSAPWQHKVILLHTLAALDKKWDVETGYREISKVGSIDSVKDPMLLAMYLNLSGDRLSFADRLRLIDRVRTTSEDKSDIIHQGVVKATLLLVHNDPRGAAQTLEEVIECCEQLDDLDPYQLQKYGQSLFIMGCIILDTKKEPERASEFLNRAVIQFEKYMEIDDLSDTGRVNGHRDLADTYRIQKEWQSALRHYDAAINVANNPILHVFKAECLNGLGELDQALAEIDDVPIGSFDCDEEKADYILHFAMLAVSSGEKERLQKARSQLAIPIKREPIFHQQALQMSKVVLETMESGKSSSLVRKARQLLTSVGSSLMLQPNFMGIGINLNKLIDQGMRPASLPREKDKK